MSGAPTTRAAVGDLIVENGTYLIENIEQPIDGNVEVRIGGELIVRDGTLSVISNNDPALKHTITVFAGGKLTLDHGVITTYLDQINPWPFLNLVVDGGEVVATGLSEFMFPGNITLMNGATMSLYDSTIHALPGEKVLQYVVDSSGAVTYDAADDGPAITLTDSTLELYDSSIMDIPEYPTNAQFAKNMTLNGASTLLAVNSFIAVDFGPALSLGQWYVHNVLLLNDRSTAQLYGTSFEPYGGNNADRAPAVVADGESYVGLPLTDDPILDTTSGQFVSSLWQSNEGMTYHVFAGQTMALDTFDAGAAGVTVDGVTLLVRYGVDPGYDGTRSLMWSTNEGGTWTSTGITPTSDDTAPVEASYDLYAAGVTTTDALAVMDLAFTNDASAQQVQFDSISLIVTIGPEAYVYRWLNVTVGDEYGVPIPGATVSAVFTGSSGYGGQPSFYFGADGVHPLPPSAVVDYMGKNASTFSVTGEDGIAIVPYLTDIISGGQASNSLFVGSFAVTGAFGIYSSSAPFSFPAYPAMTSSDQSFDFTVSIEGISAPSPDPSKWLVVPPSLHIYDMTYYHAGDVIVAAGGTLRFTSAVFQLVQSYANQRAVYVDGNVSSPALLVFEKSRMVSSLPITIVVQGDATLQVLNSTLTGVSIFAREGADVVLVNSTMDGTLTTEWNAAANVVVKDSTLVQSPVLSGTTVGGFTNTSVPSITVQRSAVALIYRWIHVTVLDGAGKPLPGATVSTRYYVNNTPATSAVSDTFGVAKVNSLGTKLTSSGSTYVGNYWVNVTYWSPPLYPEKEISVGVLPYTTPLGKNATYATVTIADALPDLAVHQTPIPITTDPLNPKMGDNVTVYATVHNDGVSRAYDVRVDFYDDAYNDSIPQPNELFASKVIPIIEPSSSAVAVAYWTAVAPRAPDAHRLIIVVDPLDTIPELNNTAPATGYGFVTVKNLPDIYVFPGTVFAPEIRASTSYVERDIQTTLTANIYNIGDNNSYNVRVDFLDGAALIGTYTVPFIAAGSAAQSSMPWTPTTIATHTITVKANPLLWLAFEELRYDNNNASVGIMVYDHPNLQLTAISIAPAGSVAGGQTVTVSASLRNLNPVPFSNPFLRLYFNYSSVSQIYERTLFGMTLTDQSGSVDASISFTAPTLTQETYATVVMIVNPNGVPIETSLADNIVAGALTILDIRADLSIDSGDIYVQRGGSNTTGETFGRTVTVNALVHNLGGSIVSVFEVRVGVRNAAGYNHTLHRGTDYNISANATDNTLLVKVNWLINLTTSGPYEIWVWLDPANSVSEPYETNNFANRTFTVQQLQVSVSVTLDAAEYDAGDIMIITATITYQGTSEGVKSLPGVVFWLIDPTTQQVVPYSNSSVETTDADGNIILFLRIPTGIETGTYAVRTVVLGQNYDSTTTVHISAAVEGGLFPWWVWIIIIVAVVGVVAGFTVYTYIYGLGKLVECGECGAFIPAASKRCPKCGVEFEAGTMKCSECGAWIPAESTECPNCGVKFVGETEAEEDYLGRMKKEYDEMVSKYRELAKPELGKKFSDKAFEEWWMKQPGYISFEDWLAKEEAKKKEGPIPCPVCGTLNPKEATVCHKCGTVFGVEKAAPPVQRKGPPPSGPAVEPTPPAEKEAAPPAAPPAAAPRMVIRRPIDRKVVPKKIIKTPVGGEEKKEGEEGGEEEGQ